MNTEIPLKFRWWRFTLVEEFLVWTLTQMIDILTESGYAILTMLKAFLAHIITFTLNQRCRMK
ncbi:hypothetical protein AEU42_21420 [Salmonella enterica subsp. enterica serovar Hadar]|nr:hypothetical protein BFF41_07490 [Salmonella enterica subsp. enterica serovar Senftenberg]ELP09531.1 hypothetical protein F514_22387 [Salmonella enterica subsp. enterica serovar Agona str. SH08SF124]ESH39062.1 hypothetical protein SEEB9115_03437 [Salmonella enterica subsp. enterica serovar Bareilly str. ATCC 9115]KDQ91849.1 hypothetical protein SEEB0179_11995 [Salmonella enterica subsp. enterica serovar Bareilly str. CFSAN000179]KFU67656.1 hypothetical protein EB94_09630 [Salmonella enterica